MAQHTYIQLEDDLEGGPADETITFGLDGQTLEIDLNEKNAARLREALDVFVPHARKVGAAHKPVASRTRASRTSSAPADEPEPSQVREWAESNGYQVSTRGRIARKVMDAFKATVG